MRPILVMLFYLYGFYVFAAERPTLDKVILSEIEKGLVGLGVSEDFYKEIPASKPTSTSKKRAIKSKKPERLEKQDWMLAKSSGSKDWFEDKKKSIDGWQKFRLETLSRWQQKKKRFHKNIKIYKKNAVELPVSPDSVINVENKYDDKYISKGRKKIIDQAFYRRAIDQGSRPTCVAFASVRAMEILLARENRWQNLSEQYFYFLSKPECQKSPCSTPGSWATKGLEAAMSKGLSLEQSCPYKRTSMVGNETQLPLPAGCYEGEVKLKSFYKVKTVENLIEALDKNHPVIAGMRLTENFYKNNGVIPWEDKMKKGGDSHADGHAALIVGYYVLPNNLILNQGRYCFVTTNSWGEGWGAGGHACLTEKWFNQQRYKISMLAVSKI